MRFELDHLFIVTDIGAAIADRLVAFGLTEGRSNVHPGQGTANRCFFFHNAMLELLWVHDPAEAQSAAIQPTHLWDRWANRHQDACPLGICVRSGLDAGDAIAFESWDYHPPYLPENLSIAVGANSEVLTEPMLFQTSFGKRPDQATPERAQPLDHPIGWRELTRVTIAAPTTNAPSTVLQTLLDTRLVQLRSGAEYCLELGFDGELQGQQADFRPSLPLMVNW
jgi:Glyoxalase-like domain